MEISEGCWWDPLSPEGLSRVSGTASKVGSCIQVPEGVFTCTNFSKRKSDSFPTRQQASSPGHDPRLCQYKTQLSAQKE